MKFAKFTFFDIKRSEFLKHKVQPDLMTHFNNIDRLIDEHRFDQGLAYIAGLFDQVSKFRDMRVRGYLQLSQGICYRKMAFLNEETEGFVKAAAAFEEALDLFKETGWECGPVQINLGVTLSSLAQYRERELNTEKAINAFEKAKAVLEKALSIHKAMLRACLFSIWNVF